MSSDDDNLVLFRRVPASLRGLELEQFARLLQQKVGEGRAFRCLITDDKELQRLNAQFLGRRYPTDVLSFPEPERGEFLGEMAISANRAALQARDLGHSVGEEIRILMLHGFLHLLGFDHETDRGEMAAEESRWRTELGLPLGLIERATP